MPSAARKAFDSNMNDIEQLIDYYDTAEAIFKDTKQDIPAGADVVLRAAFVLLITYWEAYLEDVVSEALDHLVAHTRDPAELPKELKQAVAKEIKTDQHELSPWKLAGEGWRDILKARLPQMQEGRDRRFNTPKSAQTRDFIRAALGIADITCCWKVDAKSPEVSSQWLDRNVRIRGKIVHRGKLSKPVSVRVIKAVTDFTKTLVAKTDDNINVELAKVTQKSLW